MSWIKRTLALIRGKSAAVVTPAKAPFLLPPDIPLEEEELSDYDPKHYYPTKIGEIVNGSYQVTNKLGYGRSSTVWLARDIRRWPWQNDHFVALKILSGSPVFKEITENEAEISKHVMKTQPEHIGLYHIRKFYDSFTIQGPDSAHACLVCEPMHIQRGNILMSVEDSSLLEKAFRAEQNEPAPCKIAKDRAIYCSILTLSNRSSLHSLPKLTDFGNAVRGDLGPFNHPIQPDKYRAPEVSLLARWSYSVDVWNLGVVMWSMLEGSPLCEGIDPNQNCYTVHAQLGQLIALLGPPPDELLSRGKDTLWYFSADGHFKYPDLIPNGYTLEKSVTKMEGEDKRLFLEFARRMLCWLPEERATCKELLDDPWLRFKP